MDSTDFEYDHSLETGKGSRSRGEVGSDATSPVEPEQSDRRKATSTSQYINTDIPVRWRVSGGVREAPLGGFPQGPVANEPKDPQSPSSLDRAGFSIDRVIAQYQSWRAVPTTLVWRAHDYLHGKTSFHYSRSPKRGDRLYAKRVKRRFFAIADSLPDLKFFKYGVHGNVESSLLYLTFTYARSYGLQESWINNGSDFNRTRSYLFKKYGRLSVVRSWESHEDGFSHIHALIYFHKYSFKGFSHRNKKGKLTYRAFERDEIEKCWKHGHVDVQLMSSFGSGFRYLSKYLSKSVEADDKDSKTVKTLAMCWLFNKRAFSLSRDWQKCAHDLILLYNNSNHDPHQLGLSSFLDPSIEPFCPIKWSLLGWIKGDHVLLPEDYGKLNSFDTHTLILEPQFQRAD